MKPPKILPSFSHSFSHIISHLISLKLDSHGLFCTKHRCGHLLHTFKPTNYDIVMHNCSKTAGITCKGLACGVQGCGGGVAVQTELEGLEVVVAVVRRWWRLQTQSPLSCTLDRSTAAQAQREPTVTSCGPDDPSHIPSTPLTPSVTPWTP